MNKISTPRPKPSGLNLLAETTQRVRKNSKKNSKKNIINNNNNKEIENGIAKLVLTLVKVLIDLLERQAERRVIKGSLTPYEVETLGSAFIKIRQTFHDVVRKFGFRDEDLDFLLEPVKTKVHTVNSSDEHILSTSVLVDVLDKLINKQTIVTGQIVVSVANVELIILNLLGALLPPE